MPRGDNPNSRANLIKNSDLTPSERKKKASKMGKASGEARRTLGTFKDAYKRTMTDEDLKAIIERVRDMARRGNLNALDRLLKISGEDQVANTEDNDQVRAFLDALKGGGQSE